MVYLTILAVVALAAAGMGWLGARAVREEYLLALPMRHGGTVWLERRTEQYLTVPATLLPLAALRFGVRLARAEALAARDRWAEARTRRLPAVLADR